MPIDVPVQTVDVPVVENQVYVVPGVNWDIGHTRIADNIEIADDPDHFYSLEMVDAPEIEAEPAVKPEGLDTLMKSKPVKKKVLIKRKHAKKKIKPTTPPANRSCNCP